ncbi:gephyrin-like molybdotransferase Glp [Marivita sp. GX14005]|uniref:molybdopterin molybdotransferase MoeA n=1 Tax=Marivita sp. GX14005 TaxID=2942276 RepID=UPI0020193DC3|nr:gephyrin-like molybdotransferase Glp [Marivita sp. GX14005]MCL3882566.1 molybdopterin molybdotransferase MoeA [Marivita sp. GX14005]
MHMDRTIEGCGCDRAGQGGDLIALGDAITCATAQVSPIAQTEEVPLAAATGRTAAQDILAPAAMPFFDNSAMDGFAVRRADLEGRCCLPVAGTVAAGDRPRDLPEGAALRIFTGAPLPRGADTVAMIEACVDKGHKVHFEEKPPLGSNIRRRGSDQAKGAVIAAAHTKLAPHHIGLLAANGITGIEVLRRPRVAVFSTGDEVQAGVWRDGQIPDANRPMLCALLRGAGAEVSDLGILPDDAAATAAALEGLGDRFDLIVTSGAVSMGGKDHVRSAFIDAGGTVQGWRVALKPGKPVMFGKLGRAAFTGLPGNPFAVHVGFHLFLAAQIDRLMGRAPRSFARVPAIAGFDWSRTPGRAEVFPARLARYDATGRPVLERLGRSVSATLLPLSAADGLAMVPADASEIAVGDGLAWHPFCM